MAGALGGRQKNSGVARGVGEGGGPDPPRAYRKGDKMPPCAHLELTVPPFLPSVSQFGPAVTASPFFMKHWGIWLSYSKS